MSQAHRTRLVAAALALSVSAALPAAQRGGPDWAQYGGPERNGTIQATLPDHPVLTVAWRKPLPNGVSAVALSEGRAFTLGSDGSDDAVYALDAATGKELWHANLGPTHTDARDGPGSTPAVGGGLVFALGSSCRLQAMKVTDGSTVWQRNLADDYKSRFATRGGCGMSPLLSQAIIVIPTGAPDGGARVVALERASGKQVWAATDLPSSIGAALGTADFGGVPQVLYHHAKPPGVSGISSVSADKGATLWQLDLPDGMSDTMPLALPGNRVLIQTWASSTLFEAGLSSKPLWTTTEISASGPAPVYFEGHLYAFGGNSGEFLKCLDAATGAVRWSSRLYRGALLLAGRTLVVLSESSGLLRLVAADPAAYREQGRASVLTPGARTMTPPSFAQGRIFLRNLDEIVAVTVK
jgi:outer membrane protein assembly factor BamB